MSVVVLGMEMPECCQDCEGHLVGEWNEYDEMCDTCIFVLSEHPWEPEHKEIDGIDTSKSIPDWCPLRPLPEKHGRLIDADDYAAEMKKRQDNAMLWKEKAARNNDMTIFARGDQAIRTFSEAKLTLDNMETIVEAEGD